MTIGDEGKAMTTDSSRDEHLVTDIYTINNTLSGRDEVHPCSQVG